MIKNTKVFGGVSIAAMQEIARTKQNPINEDGAKRRLHLLGFAISFVILGHNLWRSASGE
jgi:hypothetical protein